jgi:hypothetical protein
VSPTAARLGGRVHARNDAGAVLVVDVPSHSADPVDAASVVKDA